MSETKAPWSPARAVLPPDPNGHNRALDRVAAEHLREVAPGLAASPAPPQPEPAKANAPRKGSKAWAIQEACRIVGIAFHGIAEYDEASDCFCSESPHEDYRNGGHALAFVEAAVREKLAREKAPAPPAEAKGEMSEETLHEWLCNVISESQFEEASYWRPRIVAEFAALRTRAREAEDVWVEVTDAAMKAWDKPMPYNDSPIELIAKIIDERDEAREQRDAAERRFGNLVARWDRDGGHRQANDAGPDATLARVDEEIATHHGDLDTERAARVAAEAEREAYRQDRDLTAHRLAAAEAEVKRRDEYPHPCLVCFGVRPLSGKPCACGGTNNVYKALEFAMDAWAKGEVREESYIRENTSLRASVARLVEAGDEARDILNAILDNQYTYRERVDAVDRWVARWAAAKAGRARDAPAGSEAK